MLNRIVLLTLFLFAAPLSAEERFSFGAGLGISYSGLGINMSHITESDMKYISAGCFSHSTYYGSTCGAGFGWIKTDLIDSQSNKHGFGAYLGTVGAERTQSEHKSATGLGISYHYFMNGIDKPGANFGVSYLASNDSDGAAILFQAGYQF